MALIMTRRDGILGGRRIFMVAALVLFACQGDQQAEQPLTVPPTTVQADDESPVIAVLGNSLSAGLGLAESEAFPALLEDLLEAEGFPVQVLNAGVSGDTSAGGLSRVDWVLRQQPDVLVVELGGNDALRGQPLENTEENLRAIVRRGRTSGAKVLLLGMDVPTNYGPQYRERFSEMYQRIASTEGATLVPDFVRELGSDPTLLQPDGLHPTTEGQKRLALKVLPHLSAILRDLAESTQGEAADPGSPASR